MKSAYHNIKKWNNTSPNHCSTSLVDNEISQLKTIPKHVRLARRILNISLPIKQKLASRHVSCDPFSLRCVDNLGKINHVFGDCK